MVAGRELDALVAERVMGYRCYIPCNPKWKGEIRRILWLQPWSETSFKPWDGNPEIERFGDWDREVRPYSTEIAAAWQVVEKMKDDRQAALVLGSNGLSNQISAWFNDGMWALARSQNTCPEHGDKNILGCATADTAPLAICLASLKALGVEIPA